MDAHRLEKLKTLKDIGVNPYVSTFKENLLKEKYKVTVAGRVMSIRSFGKASFLTILDRSGTIQIYIKKGEIDEKEFVVFQNTDIGDFIGVSGYLFKTKTDELTVFVEKFSLLTKTHT